MLITHLGLTRDPPQKWFPFLRTRGQRSYTAQQSVFYLFTASSNTISSQTHLSLRLTVHGEFPGIPFTIRILVAWKRSSLFPHSLNSTFSAFTKRWRIIVKTQEKACRQLQIVAPFSFRNWPTGSVMDTFSPAVWKQQETDESSPHNALNYSEDLKIDKESRVCTTLFDGTVVKLSFGVGGVAPGSVLVPIWVTTVVLCQIGFRMRPWVYSGKSHRSF